VGDYLQTRRAEAEAIRREVESRQDTAGFRARVRACRIECCAAEELENHVKYIPI